jgi:hypothetical protein
MKTENTNPNKKKKKKKKKKETEMCRIRDQMYKTKAFKDVINPKILWKRRLKA